MEILFYHTWWSYQPEPDFSGDDLYHWFNLFEGCAWILFAVLVIARYAQRRHSILEIAYALAFLLFGLTDFQEARALNSWLIWLKLLNLIVLLKLRAIVIRRYYPASKLY
jgi:hypothetical protein